MSIVCVVIVEWAFWVTASCVVQVVVLQHQQYTQTTAVLKCGQTWAAFKNTAWQTSLDHSALLKAKGTWSTPVNATIKIQFRFKARIVVCFEASVETNIILKNVNISLLASMTYLKAQK